MKVISITSCLPAYFLLEKCQEIMVKRSFFCCFAYEHASLITKASVLIIQSKSSKYVMHLMRVKLNQIQSIEK